MRSAIANRFSPMKVRQILRRLRSKSCAFSCASSAPICIVSADCDTCSAEAACVKLCSLATVRNAFNGAG
jgi:hypothetical protein